VIDVVQEAGRFSKNPLWHFEKLLDFEKERFQVLAKELGLDAKELLKLKSVFLNKVRKRYRLLGQTSNGKARKTVVLLKDVSPEKGEELIRVWRRLRALFWYEENLSQEDFARKSTFSKKEQEKRKKYKIIPVCKREAAEFVEKHHRHNGYSQRKMIEFAKLVLGAKHSENGELVGVVVAGHPRARVLQEKEPLTLEVWRLCVKEGNKNACSFLLGATCRIAKEMGYKKVITYTLASETGSSLRAAGFSREAVCKPNKKGWSCGKRKRPSWSEGQKKLLTEQEKIRWVREL